MNKKLVLPIFLPIVLLVLIVLVSKNMTPNHQFVGDKHISYYPEDLLIWQKHYDQPPSVVFENHRCDPVAQIQPGSVNDAAASIPATNRLVVRYDPHGKLPVPEEIALPEAIPVFYHPEHGWINDQELLAGTLWNCHHLKEIFTAAAFALLAHNEIKTDGTGGIKFNLPSFELDLLRLDLDCSENANPQSVLPELVSKKTQVEIVYFSAELIGLKTETELYCVPVQPDFQDTGFGLGFQGWSYDSIQRQWFYHTSWYKSEAFNVFPIGKVGKLEINEHNQYTFIGTAPTYQAPQQR